jgi:xylulokinase
MRIGLEGFNKLGFKAKEIRLIGGGAKSPLWQKIAANVLKLPIRLPSGGEAAALGGAIQALWCAGLGGAKPGGSGGASIGELCDEHVTLEGALITPDPTEAAAYDEAYGVYSRYLAALSPLYT